MTRAMSVKAVIFDLDGTLIELKLDFAKIRRILGVRGRYILESIIGDRERRKKLETLKRFEVEAAKRARPARDACKVLRRLKRDGIKICIVTRNCRESVDVAVRKLGVKPDFIVTREDCRPKPSPVPVKLCLKRLGLKPEDCIVVGDYLFDVIAGKRANVKTAIIINRRNVRYARLSDYVLKRLGDLLKVCSVG